jgi:hypothetical protein
VNPSEWRSGNQHLKNDRFGMKLTDGFPGVNRRGSLTGVTVLIFHCYYMYETNLGKNVKWQSAMPTGPTGAPVILNPCFGGLAA